MAEEDPDHRRQQAHRHDQDDRDRQDHALVLGGQHQEDQQDNQREDGRGRVTRQDLLIVEVGPFEVHALRQGFVGDLFDGGLGLAGRIAGRRRAVDVGGQEAVIAAGRDRTEARIDRHQGRQGHHLARIGADLQVTDVFRTGAIGRVGLDPDAVGAAEAVEVVDILRPQIDLHGLEDIADRDAKLAGAGAVDIGEDLRDIDLVRGVDAGQFLGLVGLGDQGLNRLVEFVIAERTAVLDL